MPCAIPILSIITHLTVLIVGAFIGFVASTIFIMPQSSKGGDMNL